MTDEKVDQVCVREVVVAEPHERVRDAARRMRENGTGTLVVIDGLRRPLGIVTDRDVTVRCVAESHDPARLRLRDVMSGPVAWVHTGASVDQAAEEMARLKVRRLPVVDASDRLVGILALDDLLARLLDDTSPVGRALHATLGA